jgi:predicted amidohydrolase
MKTRQLIIIAIAFLFSISANAKGGQDRISTMVAAVQLQASDVGNFDKMKSLAAAAKQQGAQLVIFPESSIFGWLNPAVFTEAEPIPGKFSDQFSAIAKSVNIWVAAGIEEKGPKAGPGSLPNAYQAYDSGILINPQGELVLHHRKYNVLKNAFNPDDCKKILGQDQCSYTEGSLSDIAVVQTPFGKTSLMVCADAYIPSQYNTGYALKTLKALSPEFVIVPWGITAGTQRECGTSGFNATGYASEAASFLKSAFVIGANGVGQRIYGQHLPSVYCGTSGYADPTGHRVEATNPTEELVLFTVSNTFAAEAGPILNNAVDAPKKCPNTCATYNAKWDGQWWTTVWGKMSVCECIKNGTN